MSSNDVFYHFLDLSIFVILTGTASVYPKKFSVGFNVKSRNCITNKVSGAHFNSKVCSLRHFFAFDEVEKNQ